VIAAVLAVTSLAAVVLIQALTFAGQVYRFLPFVLGPDDTRRIHGADERVSVESHLDCVRFYIPLLKKEARSSA